MRSLCLLMPALLLCSSYLPAKALPLRVEEGTPVRLKVQEAITTKRFSEGQKLQLSVLEDVTANDGGPVLIKSGASALAFLIEAEKTKGSQAGKLSIEISSTKAIDGTKVPLRGVKTKVGKSRAGVGSYVVSGLFLGPIGLGAVAYFGRGKNAVIPAGTVVCAFVDRDTNLTCDASSLASRSATLSVQGSRLSGAPVPGDEPELRGGMDAPSPPSMTEPDGGGNLK